MADLETIIFKSGGTEMALTPIKDATPASLAQTLYKKGHHLIVYADYHHGDHAILAPLNETLKSKDAAISHLMMEAPHVHQKYVDAYLKGDTGTDTEKKDAALWLNNVKAPDIHTPDPDTVTLSAEDKKKFTTPEAQAAELKKRVAKETIDRDKLVAGRIETYETARIGKMDIKLVDKRDTDEFEKWRLKHNDNVHLQRDQAITLALAAKGLKLDDLEALEKKDPAAYKTKMEELEKHIFDAIAEDKYSVAFAKGLLVRSKPSTLKGVVEEHLETLGFPKDKIPDAAELTKKYTTKKKEGEDELAKLSIARDESRDREMAATMIAAFDKRDPKAPFRAAASIGAGHLEDTKKEGRTAPNVMELLRKNDGIKAVRVDILPVSEAMIAKYGKVFAGGKDGADYTILVAGARKEFLYEETSRRKATDKETEKTKASLDAPTSPGLVPKADIGIAMSDGMLGDLSIPAFGPKPTNTLTLTDPKPPGGKSGFRD